MQSKIRSDSSFSKCGDLIYITSTWAQSGTIARLSLLRTSLLSLYEYTLWNIYRMSQQKRQLLINNRTKVFCLIFLFSLLDSVFPDLDFEMKTIQIRLNLSEIFSFEVHHSKFYRPNFGDLGKVNFLIIGRPSPKSKVGFWVTVTLDNLEF